MIEGDSMRIRRGLLFWGLFLIPVGGLPLLVEAGLLDASIVADAWRLWPLLLVALGVALILGRDRAGVLGTTIAALALGLVVGGALAAGTPWFSNVGDCRGATGADNQAYDGHGTFTADASARFELDCGALNVSVAPGTDWRIHADYRGNAPSVEQTDTSLDVRSVSTGFSLRRATWTATLPADALRQLEIHANAATGTIDLSGANLTRLSTELNAGDLRIDASAAKVASLDASMNAGRLRLRLGDTTSGSLSANAGAMELCVPPDATLHLRVKEQLTFGHNLATRGLTRNGDIWSRAGAATAPVIDLSVDGNAASFTLDPDGGC
jgi:hypothetical protein